ncbi:unnamed protein product [Symbiodinium sp. CCMP2456]|nr:unnamed protein product [Symbiodinium sp. CCMP2456]
MEALWKRHPDIVPVLCGRAPSLLHTLLDGLIWKSSKVMQGMRRVNYYVGPLLVDEELRLTSSIPELVKHSDPVVICHPCAIFVSDLLWSRICGAAFLYSKVLFVLSLLCFIIGFQHIPSIDYDGPARFVVIGCRLFTYAISLGQLLAKHAYMFASALAAKDTRKNCCVPLPAYLTRSFKDFVEAILVLHLLALLCMEPVLHCLRYDPWKKCEAKQLSGNRRSILPKKIDPKMIPVVDHDVIEALRQKVLQASFFMADKDRDNILSKSEFSLMVRRAYPDLKEAMLDKAFILAGFGSGCITFRSFQDWVALQDHHDESILEGHHIDPLSAVWRLWNLDGDDSLSVTEFEYCILRAFPKMKRMDLLLILRAMDEDLSGEVAQEEFAHFLLPPVRTDPFAPVLECCHFSQRLCDVESWHRRVSCIPMLLYFVLTSELIHSNIHLSCFVLLVASLWWDMLVYCCILAFLTASFASAMACLPQTGSSFGVQFRDFRSLPSAFQSLLAVAVKTYSANSFEEIAAASEPLLAWFLLAFAGFWHVFLMNLMVAQLCQRFGASFKDALGYARLKRGSNIFDTALSLISESRWQRFIRSLNLDAPCPLDASDPGPRGGIPTLEEFDGSSGLPMQLYGGLASPNEPWPELRDSEESEFDNFEKTASKRFDDLERLLADIADKLGGRRAGLRLSLRSSPRSSVASNVEEWSSRKRASVRQSQVLADSELEEADLQ